MNVQTIASLLLAITSLHAVAQVQLNTAPNPGWKTAISQATGLYNDGKFAEATVVAKRALVIAKRSGPSDDGLPATYFLLGTINREWGHCAEARANYAHAIGIWGKRQNPNHVYMFNSILALINTEGECEDYDAARKTYRARSAELQRYSSGPLDEAKLLSVRAAFERQRKNYAQAEALVRQALDVFEHSPGGPLPEIAELRSNLAVIIGEQRRNAAESLAEADRAIVIFEQTDQRRPAMVAALNSAACSLAGLGRKDEAERMFQRALNLASDLFGGENHWAATIMLNYAQLLRKNKQSPAASVMERKGTEALRRAREQDNATVDVSDLGK